MPPGLCLLFGKARTARNEGGETSPGRFTYRNSAVCGLRRAGSLRVTIPPEFLLLADRDYAPRAGLHTRCFALTQRACPRLSQHIRCRRNEYAITVRDMYFTLCETPPAGGAFPAHQHRETTRIRSRPAMCP